MGTLQVAKDFEDGIESAERFTGDKAHHWQNLGFVEKRIGRQGKTSHRQGRQGRERQSIVVGEPCTTYGAGEFEGW
jgi:hypothetical protein